MLSGHSHLLMKNLVQTNSVLDEYYVSTTSSSSSTQVKEDINLFPKPRLSVASSMEK